jgi:hypothetical protein
MLGAVSSSGSWRRSGSGCNLHTTKESLYAVVNAHKIVYLCRHGRRWPGGSPRAQIVAIQAARKHTHTESEWCAQTSAALTSE